MADHAGDLLSVLLDGELDAHEAAAVRAHVDACDDCAGELGVVRAARRLLRELPAVEPPPAFLAQLLAVGDDVVSLAAHRRRSRLLPGVAAAVAAAAAVLALVVLAPWSSSDRIDPALDLALEHHESTVGALEDDGTLSPAPGRLGAARNVPPTTAAVQQLSDVEDDIEVPSAIAGYELVEVYDLRDGVHLLFHRGPFALSVFEREGTIDWDELPDGGTSIELAGHRAWRWDDIVDGRLVVIEGEGVVITVAGDEPRDVVLDVARAIARQLP